MKDNWNPQLHQQTQKKLDQYSSHVVVIQGNEILT